MLWSVFTYPSDRCHRCGFMHPWTGNCQGTATIAFPAAVITFPAATTNKEPTT